MDAAAAASGPALSGTGTAQAYSDAEPPASEAEPAFGITNRLPLMPGGSVKISFSVNNDLMTEPKNSNFESKALLATLKAPAGCLGLLRQTSPQGDRPCRFRKVHLAMSGARSRTAGRVSRNGDSRVRERAENPGGAGGDAPLAARTILIYDVIVVGAGPGGSSAANFLARQGISTLLLDTSAFPRDKVCGDGLTPEAVYWLNRLECADAVLAQTNGCIKSADIIINNEHVLTGGFPDGTIYPDFAILLDRRRFDNIILESAIAEGARFIGNTLVRCLAHEHIAYGLKPNATASPSSTAAGS